VSHSAGYVRDVKPKERKRAGPLRRERYGGWLLYFWHGMRLGQWLKLLAQGRYRITANCLPGIATVTLFAPVNSLLYRVSEAVYANRIDALRLDDAPIFVLGHWRTGTTLLHDLFACDPRLAYPTTYECFFPNHFLLTERVLSRAFSVFLPKRRPQDAVSVGFDRPQEEEFAFSLLGMGTPYNTMAWPRLGPADQAYLDLEGLSADERAEWAQSFLWFYRRLQLKHDKTLVLKSPAHTARLALLTRLFPRARFVHISRHPFEVIPSTLKLWRALFSTQGLQNPPNADPWLSDWVLESFARMSEAYEANRKPIEDGRLTEIRYEDLVKNPKQTMRLLYSALNLGDFRPAESGMDAYLARQKDHPVSKYELPQALKQQISHRLSAYMARFGYALEDQR
jgi:omega-hydroxy-beta-dihydromenaquinone-9 sulfotransferase